MRTLPTLDGALLQAVENTTLFYPHSASDFRLPIRLFAPFVKDFWFADLGHFGPSDPADKARPIINSAKDYKFLGAEIMGPPVAVIERRPYPFIEPCVRTESYLHVESNQIVRLHRRRGFSVSAFHKLPNIGVFFYRRDSSEGSSVAWLAAPDYSPRKRQKWLVQELMDKMSDKGLIVTDGSRCDGKHNPYKGFRQFSRDRTIGEEAVSQAEPFEDLEGRKFECVGYAGKGNGPTLIWQISK